MKNNLSTEREIRLFASIVDLFGWTNLIGRQFSCRFWNESFSWRQIVQHKFANRAFRLRCYFLFTYRST